MLLRQLENPCHRVPDGLEPAVLRPVQHEVDYFAAPDSANRIIRRTSLITLGVAVLAVAGLVTGTFVRARLIGPANMATDGILFTGDGTTTTPSTTAALDVGASPAAASFDPSNGVLSVDLSIDYAGPDAATFETTNGSTIQGWVTQGYATLSIHPVALVSFDSNSQSMRTANTIACVADQAPSSVPWRTSPPAPPWWWTARPTPGRSPTHRLSRRSWRRPTGGGAGEHRDADPHAYACSDALSRRRSRRLHRSVGELRGQLRIMVQNPR
ncbi:hypothetical protein [Subtercola boreus]|nr:hypothetical protein [Subtercola boreus]